MRRIFNFILFNLNFLLLIWQTRFDFPLASQSPLCEITDAPCKQENSAMCQLKYYKLNSTECKDMTFNDRLPSIPEGSDEFGSVELKSYYYNLLTFKMTAFNLSFSQVKWKHIKFRFKQIGNDMKNMCRELYIISNATVNDLFYDCIWSNEAYEGKPFFLEYEASDEAVKIYQRFTFHVPLAKNVDIVSTEVENWETFTYVEAVPVSNGLGPLKFYLHWQPLPEKFFIETYNISVWSNDTGNTELVHSTTVSCNNSRDCTFVYSKWYGTIQFGVEPLSNYAHCSTTCTLLFQFGGEQTKPLIIGIVCATFTVSAALYIIYALRRCVVQKKGTVIKRIPKVLFIYSSSVSAHVKVVLNLADYLKNHCSVEPLVDELHIFTSKSRDPFKWCNESFKLADCVMVIASPSANNKRLTDSLYKNMDLLMLRFLRENLCTRSSKTKFFLVMMPYSTEWDIPPEAQNLRKFLFPRDLNKILLFIHEIRGFRTLFHGDISGGKQDYKLHGKKLGNAIDEAQQWFKKRRMMRNFPRKIARDNGDFDSDHELLTFISRNSFQNQVESIIHRERLKEIMRENLLNFPIPFESINLLGDEEEEDDEEEEEEEAEDSDCYKDNNSGGFGNKRERRTVPTGKSININEMNL